MILTVHLAHGGEAGLHIYNMLGQEVRGWSKRKFMEEDHQLIWDPAQVASGTYIARFTVPGGKQTLTKRITIVK